MSEDGSYTAYSKEYDEHYHSTKDGALHESLVKHVIPALTLKKNQETITILDICFGLGFNTFATLHYVQANNITSKIKIYSPELDAKLVASLEEFTYPKEFKNFEKIIQALVRDKVYKDDVYDLELFVGDAREYILNFNEDTFDVVYQDAFSPSTNPVLWTQEYFADIKRILKLDGILTTYSTALPTRLALYEQGLNIYLNTGKNYRSATIASQVLLDDFSKVDMKHKISCNPDVKSLRD